MTNIFPKLFSHQKFIIAGVHFLPLPGSPNYDREAGIKAIIKRARHDVSILVDSGVDSILFANEADFPWTKRMSVETIAAFSAVVQEISSNLTIPFGINALVDTLAGTAIAHATGAAFIRGYFSGTYATDLGLFDTCGADTARLRNHLGATRVNFIHNLDPSFGTPLGERSRFEIVQGAITQHHISVFTMAANKQTYVDLHREFPNVTLLVGRGASAKTIVSLLEVADGAIVASCLKENGQLLNPVDPDRVQEFMSIVNQFNASK